MKSRNDFNFFEYVLSRSPERWNDMVLVYEGLGTANTLRLFVLEWVCFRGVYVFSLEIGLSEAEQHLMVTSLKGLSAYLNYFYLCLSACFIAYADISETLLIL